jgi:hypothetical protein
VGELGEPVFGGELLVPATRARVGWWRGDVDVAFGLAIDVADARGWRAWGLLS